MNKVVTLPNYGKVKCCLVSKANDQKAMSVMNFIGIPFAQPPVGRLRFMPPQKALPWQGVLAKKMQRKIPVQLVASWENSIVYTSQKRDFQQHTCDEDCLYLNVFVPESSSRQQLPVMVWFYGGAFQIGPNFFIDGTALAGMNNVIVVVPNYRVNTFGFMTMGIDSQCKGNMGLLDQVQALRWVNENIEYFGGDKDNVTIFGESAGGISCSMHMLSPLSKGLFHKAISHSGVATCSKMYMRDQKRVFHRLLKILKISDTDEDTILEKLQALPTEVIMKANVQLALDRYTWLATLDNNFFPDDPIDLLSQGHAQKIPFILGCNSDEGGWTMQLITPSFIDGLNREQFFYYATTMLKWYNRSLNASKIVPMLLEKYGKGRDVSDKMFYSEMAGRILADTVFLNAIVSEADRHSDSNAPTFFYYMTHAPLFNHDSAYGPVAAHKPAYVGSDHTDDIQFTFGYPFLSHQIKDGYRFSEEEQKLSSQMMTYFTNFAKHGDPNVGDQVDREWPRYTTRDRRHLLLDMPLGEGANFGVETLNLYTKVFPKL